MTRVFVARWPNGSVTVLSAETAEHAADLLDQVGNAGRCEVTPLEGWLWLTFQPAVDPDAGPLALVHRATVETDSQAAILAAAYPVLHEIMHAESPSASAWADAMAIERGRILAPSSEWKRAVGRSWDSLAPGQVEEPSQD
ncbi:MAG: hypothetical protein K8M05_09150 [Deltaproteobacteria bacterium]|nr:hypothetical protein [Kofleriaceae bacterium]